MSAATGDLSLTTAATSVTLFEKPIEFVTYIRKIDRDGQNCFAVCSDTGEQLAIFSSRDAAYFTARQFNLTLLSLH